MMTEINGENKVKQIKPNFETVTDQALAGMNRKAESERINRKE